MQLSLIDEVPEFNKKYFLDVFASSVLDLKTNKMKLVTIHGQVVPEMLKISIHSKLLSRYPEGTIYKIDTRLVLRKGIRPYFIALKAKKVQRAIEFFEYNLKVQFGSDFKYRKSKK
jgi:hypothetical protein